MIGVRRETVHRMIANLERDGALVFEDGMVTVLQPARLRAALDAITDVAGVEVGTIGSSSSGYIARHPPYSSGASTTVAWAHTR